VTRRIIDRRQCARQRHIVSGSVSNIAIEYGQSTYNKVQGNYIGVDVTGAYALGNSVGGVGVAYGAGHNIIGTDGDGVATILRAISCRIAALTAAPSP